ncbi:hypothetical protein FMJ60_21735 [Klebsiella quasipneumoniae]|nr:hypothetical protein [Klebsiella quasipneumoniae]
MIKQSENCGAMGNFAPINRRAQCTITGSGKAAYRDKSLSHSDLTNLKRPSCLRPHGSVHPSFRRYGRK